MGQGGQRRDQVDATVVPNVCRQRGAAPALCARHDLGNFLRTQATPEPIKHWLLTTVKDKMIKIGAKGSEPSLLCRVPAGRGRHPTANAPGDSAAHRGTAAAATTSTSMRRSTVIGRRATYRMSASECQGTRPDQAVKHRSDGWECREPSTSRMWASSQFRKLLPSTSVQGSSGESRLGCANRHREGVETPRSGRILSDGASS